MTKIVLLLQFSWSPVWWPYIYNLYVDAVAVLARASTTTATTYKFSTIQYTSLGCASHNTLHRSVMKCFRLRFWGQLPYILRASWK